MSEIRSMAGQQTYLAPEAVAGTPETSGFIAMPGLKLTPGWEGDRGLFRGGTGKTVTVTMGADEKSPWEADLSPDFNHLGYVLASRFALPTTTTPGGGTTSRQHVFAINPDGEDLYRSYTAIWGDDFFGVRGDYGYFNTLGMDIQRGDLAFSTDFRSRAAQFGYAAPISEVQTVSITGSPTGGTFTLTYAGQTTAPPIPYNATAAQVQAALILLSNIGPYDVACSGGPLPATPVQVRFQGTLNQTDVAAMTASGAALTPSGTVVVTATTPGANPTSAVVAPMPSNMWDVYMDSSWATLGTTKYGGAYMANFDFGEKFDEDAPINSSIISYEQPVEMAEQDGTLDLTIRLGSTAVALASAMAAGTKQYIRLALLGATIEAAIKYTCYIDVCAEIITKGTIEVAPNSSAVCLPLNLAITRDTAAANYARVTLINTVLTY